MNHPQVIHPEQFIKKDLTSVARFNTKLALLVTKSVGTVWTAYIFTLIALAGATAIITNNLLMVLVVNLISQTFLQLVLLPIIMVGQNVQQEQSQAKQEADHIALTHIAHQTDLNTQMIRNTYRSMIKDNLKNVTNLPPIPRSPK